LITNHNAPTMSVTKPNSLRFEASFGAIALIGALAILATLHLGVLTGAIGAALVIASLLAHEAGHLVAAKLCGVRVKAIGLCFKGAYLRRKDSKHAGTELVIALCGPIASILLFLILQGDSPVIRWVAHLNLVVGVSNLLPIPSTDGARIVRALTAILSAA
jgi:membrane-associated protease RseP (regulator of RpoE activity)